MCLILSIEKQPGSKVETQENSREFKCTWSETKNSEKLAVSSLRILSWCRTLYIFAKELSHICCLWLMGQWSGGGRAHGNTFKSSRLRTSYSHNGTSSSSMLDCFQHPCPSLASGPSLTWNTLHSSLSAPCTLSPLPYLHQRLSSRMGKPHLLATDFPEFPRASRILMSWCLDYWVCKCSLLVRPFLTGSSHFFFFPFLFFDTECFPASKHVSKDVSKVCPLSRNLCVFSVLCVGNKQWVDAIRFCSDCSYTKASAELEKWTQVNVYNVLMMIPPQKTHLYSTGLCGIPAI